MNAAVSALRLALILGLGLLYLLGQGWLIVGPLLHGGLASSKRGARLLHEIPLVLLSGLITNFGLTLIFQSMVTAVAVGSAASIVGMGFFGIFVFRRFRGQPLRAAALAPVLGAAFVCLLFLSPILTEPLWAWDARSIWFFHAKMIYAAGSIGPPAGWLHPSTFFAHVDYPKLVPALAAQVATVMGFWNEYLPKAALAFMLVPALLWLFGFARRSLSFLTLLLLVPLGLSDWMWNGYMDGYLALYFAIAMLLLGRYLESPRAIDMLSAIGILLVLPNIKNEGALAAVVGLPVAMALLVLKNRFTIADIVRVRHWKYLLAGLAGILPLVLWSIHKQRWGLVSDLDIGVTQSVSRVITRLLDGSLGLILGQLWAESQGALLVMGLMCCAYLAWNRPLPTQSLPALLAGILYGMGIVVIYLQTPYDVAWHLETSMLRVALAVNASIFIGSYYLLNGLEADPSLRRKPAPARRRPA